jgi:ankyrin repeat protein
MAPEFIPFIVCGLLALASVGSIGMLAVTAIAHGPLRRVLESRLPRIAPLIRPALILALVTTTWLLLMTGACAYQVRQQFFLNEPMASAASEGNIVEVRALLDRGASPDLLGIDFVETALGGAAERGHTDIVKLLLDRGADPNLKDSHERSALQCARDGPHPEVVALLLKAGARE